jgi:membrane-bound ClpP family serine protease
MLWRVRCHRLLMAAAAAFLSFILSTASWAESGASKDFYREYNAAGAYAPSESSSDEEDADYDRAGATRGTVLSLTGVIGPGAHRQFLRALAHSTPTLVVLESPGGVLGEAFLIAEEVRRRGLSTLVERDSSCSSACAIVFLSGRTKYLGAGASIGLHMASYADGRPDPEATELMAAYLRQLGVPTSALRQMAVTSPTQIRWMTRTELSAVGTRAYAAQ